MEIQKILRPGSSVYFVGIKGTGTCALAELLYNTGMKVSGSDINEVFYTDAILKELGIPYFESFNAEHIRDDFDLVVHSAAYNSESNPELARAEKLGLTILKYPDALGAYSAGFDSSGIAGVHGKTTTTAISGALAQSLGLPARILAGSAVAGFQGRSTLNMGDKYFIAETCEYRKHFLAFHPQRIILSSVESDHQDFYPTYESIRDAFLEYCRLLPSGGELIYCADDSGACEAAGLLQKEKREINFVPYGFKAEGNYRINNYRVEHEKSIFSIAAFPGEFKMRVPGRHQAQNAAAALALVSSLVKKEFGQWTGEMYEAARKTLEEFRGSKRRSELIGEAGGILFVDDYGHHPTAIKTTLEGFKSFYPQRRLAVSFMSHTYSRTAALLEEFAASFDSADILVLHKIYASAREQYSGGVNGKTLYEKIKARWKAAGKSSDIFYVEEPPEAAELLEKTLRKGDLFLTLGAGNNWPLGLELYNYFKNTENKGGGSQ
jgi:UDP-N-acetylmuramate--alanine ligase